MSRPTFGRPGLTSAFPGPAYGFSVRNIFYPGQNSRSWAGRQRIRPFLAGVSSSWASGGAESRLGQSSGAPGHRGWAGLETVRLGRSGDDARLGRREASPGWAGVVNPAWASAGQVPAGPVRVTPAGPTFANPRLGRLPPIPGLGRISPSIPCPRGWAGA
jgi:hypothetical protein